MITADLHTHSAFSTDSDEPLLEMAESAVRKGLNTLCLTEHMDFDYPTAGEFQLDTDTYRTELLRVRGELSDRLELLFGVELGLLDYLSDTLYEFASAWDFDFIIGSAHQIDGFDPFYPEYFEKYGGKNGILRFFEGMLASIKNFDNYDVLGHIDYIVRYSPEKSYDPLDYREVLDEILRTVISAGRGIEINTKGLDSLGYVHPNEWVLKRYRELGGEIVTIGSDAHDGTRIAAGFDSAEQALKSAGFERYAIYRNRKPEFVTL